MKRANPKYHRALHLPPEGPKLDVVEGPNIDGRFWLLPHNFFPPFSNEGNVAWGWLLTFVCPSYFIRVVLVKRRTDHYASWCYHESAHESFHSSVLHPQQLHFAQQEIRRKQGGPSNKKVSAYTSSIIFLSQYSSQSMCQPWQPKASRVIDSNYSSTWYIYYFVRRFHIFSFSFTRPASGTHNPLENCCESGSHQHGAAGRRFCSVICAFVLETSVLPWPLGTSTARNSQLTGNKIHPQHVEIHYYFIFIECRCDLIAMEENSFVEISSFSRLEALAKVVHENDSS